MQEPDKHQPVQQDTGVPAFVALVGDALYVREQFQMLLLVSREKLLGGFLYVQRGLDAPRGFQHRQAARFVQLGQVRHHGLQLGRKQVHRLAAKVLMPARSEPGLAGLGMFVAFDPIPLALRRAVLALGKDQQVFGVAVRDVFPYPQALRLVGPAAIHHHLNGHHAAKLRHGAAKEVHLPCRVGLPSGFARCAIPTKNIDEQALEIKRRQVFFKRGEIEFGHLWSGNQPAIKPMEHTTRGSRNAAASSA